MTPLPPNAVATTAGPSAKAPEPLPPTARRSGLRLAARWVLGIAVTAWFVLLVGWLSLHWLILPHIETWRGPIEARASRLLGAPVRIGAITVRSGSWVPQLELRDVRVLDRAGRTALVLPRVVAALSARSLLALDIRLSQLHVQSPQLEIRRDVTGRIRVAGLDLDGEASAVADDSSVADWFFAQKEFVIRAGTLRWIDEGRAAPPLELHDVDLVVRNGLRSHDVRIDATPPAGWGERFTLRGRFTQPLLAHAGDWRRWSGEAYAEMPRADVGQLRRYVTLPFELREGDGALRGWFDLRDGRPRGATVDIALRRVALRLDTAVDTLGFAQVEGRIVARREGDRTEVSVRGFGFSTDDGLRWPASDLTVAWRQREGAPVSAGEFSADRVDVGVVAAIAGGVPIGAALRRLLADVKPAGTVTRLQSGWSGPLDAPDHYRVSGKLSGLSLTPRAAARADAVGRPGLRNATIELDATENGGQAHVEVVDGALTLPGVFAEAELPLDRFAATLEWTIDRAGGAAAAPPITVRVRDASFANADVHGDLTAVWRTGAGDATALARGGRYPGVLELDAKLADAAAARAGRYLPLGLPDDVRSYVGRAIRGGKVPRATIHVRGDLYDFPFHHARTPQEGEFRFAAHVDDLELAYLPGEPVWPVLVRGSGELVVDRATLAIRAARATIGGIDWQDLNGDIATFDDRAHFDISGHARAPLADMLRVVTTTPVGRWIDSVLDDATSTGSAELKLALSIPLAEDRPASVRGSLALAGNDLRLSADTPLLGNTRGRLDFTESSFAVVGATARMLGGELAFEGGARAGAPPRFSGQGTFSAEGLRRAHELGPAVRFATVLEGQAAYRATLSFPAGRAQLGITSDLVGVGVDLPAPLGKTASTPVAFRVQTGAAAGGAATTSTADTLQLDIGSRLRARIVRDSATGHVLRGSVRIGDSGDASAPLPLPATGIAASIELKRLDVDAWEAVADRLLVGDTAADARGASVGGAASNADDYLPRSVALRAAEFVQGGRRFTRVAANLSREGAVWRADVDAKEVAGHVEYRRGSGAEGGNPAKQSRLYARLSRLSLGKGDADATETPDSGESPGRLPALDVVADDFELRGKRLGRLEIVANNQAGEGQEWQLSTFNLTVPEAKFTATGTWTGRSRAAVRRTAMDFNLDVTDSGALLDRFGIAKAVRGGKGKLSGSVAWPGSPLSADATTMTGSIHMAIDSGQFLKASPGAGRLLGVLSLQSLPRRLLLDFRDVFQEGFAFDNVTGDVNIANGTASTNNLRMRGAAAAVLMEGTADLERETQDLRVVVVPEINAGTAALAYAIINPALGLGAFLAQYLLSKPIAEASTREFRVSGPWDDPKVERVGRGAASVPAAPSASSAR